MNRREFTAKRWDVAVLTPGQGVVRGIGQVDAIPTQQVYEDAKMNKLGLNKLGLKECQGDGEKI
jgi:hypothetical protein